MSKKLDTLRKKVMDRVGIPGENLAKISRESGVSYMVLYQFYRNGHLSNYANYEKLAEFFTESESKPA